MKKKSVFPSIRKSWEEWLNMPIKEKYEELKTLYEAQNPNGDLEHFFEMELQFQIDAERELINKGTKREIHENEELIQRQLIIKYIKDEMLKKTIEKSFLSEPIYNPKIELKNYSFYNNAKSQIENNGYFIINGIKVYSAELVVLFMSDNIHVKNKFTGEDCFLNGFDFLKIFISSYQEGQKYFNENYKVSPDILYGTNAQSYASDLHNKYFHVQEYGVNEGWIFVKNMYPIFISNEAISKHGYYSGVISQADEELKKHPTLFMTFESCSESKSEKLLEIEAKAYKLGKPIFKSVAIPQIFDILKGFFASEDQSVFKELLETGDSVTTPILFLGNGNKLADTFKQLIDANIIVGCQKKELEDWIAKKFKFLYRGKVMDFKQKYLNDIISSNKDKCQKPILNVKLDKENNTFKILFP
jgi:hypothetical protein